MAVVSTLEPKQTTQPPAQLPMMNSPDEMLQLTKTATTPKPQPTQPGATTAPGSAPIDKNQQVLETAQNKAIQGFQSPISGMITQRTGEMLKQPSTINYDQYKGLQMDQYNRDRANALEASRQSLGNAGMSGENVNALIQQQLANQQGSIDLGRQLDYEIAANKQKDILSALAEGRATERQQADIYNEGINALAQARGMAEGQRAQTTDLANQQALMSLGYNQDIQKMAIANGYDLGKLDKQYGQQTAMMIAQNNWQGAQNQLDRENSLAMQSNDIAAKESYLAKQQAFDLERLSKEQDFTSYQADIDRRQQLAVQNNDIESRKYLAELQIKADAAQLQKTQDFTAVQNDIERKWKSSESTADREMQNSIIERQLALDKWKQENGQTFTAEQNAINRALETSLQSSKIAADQANSALDRELTREVEAGRLSIQEKQLAQNASQFTDEMSFKQYALKAGFDEAAADRAWKSSETALDRSGARELKAMDADLQTNLMALKGQIDNGMLASTQAFETVQRTLDRKQQEALANGEWANAIELTRLKGDIDAAAQTQAQEFSRAERIATQGWQSSERISDQDFQKAMQAIDIKAKSEEAQADRDLSKYLEEQKGLLQLKLQAQEMSQEQSMAYLNSNLAEARATGDFERQKQLLTFQYGQEVQKMQLEQGFNVANQYLQFGFQQALQNDDQAAQESVIRLQASLQAQEREKDRVIERAAQDNERFKTIYNAIQAQVDAGTLDPASAVSALQKEISGMGIQLSAAKEEDYTEAISREYNAQKYQYALTHPEEANVLPDGSIDANNPLKSSTKFNQWVNDTVFGNPSVVQYYTGEKPAEALREDPAALDAIAKNATPYTIDKDTNYYLDRANLWAENRDAYKFENTVPKVGSYINYNGTLYQVQSGVNSTPTNQNFQALDVKTGKLVTIRADGGIV